jgi:type IV pilus assembly protein PilX
LLKVKALKAGLIGRTPRAERIKQKMPITVYSRKEDGYIIIIAILILALLTIICVSGLNMSTTEIKIATNELRYERTFYAAESGLQHITELLRFQYVDGNSAILSAGGTPSWSFALQDAQDSDGDGAGDLIGGVTVIDRVLGNIDLQVRIWNNDDSGSAVNDTDGLIYVLSEAKGPRGSLCHIQMLLEGSMIAEATSDYSAQQGAGPGKHFVSSDANAMADFTQTALNAQ